MDYTTLILPISLFTAIIFLLKHRNTRLPPGPIRLPIIGNLLNIGKSPHKSLAKLSKIHGPIMSLKLGTITTIVISSHEVAKELFQKHDQPLSSRTIPDAVHARNYCGFSMVWLPPTTQWRKLRKIVAINLFSPQQLDATQALCQEKVHQLMDHVRECCEHGQPIHVGLVAFITVLNSISNTIFSMDLGDYKSYSSQEMKDIVRGLMVEAARPNVSDYFPFVRYLDLQGVRQRMNVYFDKLFVVFDEIIDDRRRLRASTSTKSTHGDVLDYLLNLNEANVSDISLNDIKHIFSDLLVAGTDTTSSTLEWAMAELLHNPETMVKAQAEIKQVLDNKKEVIESDMSSLPYLQAIVKETFRLHPPAPFLVPRKVDTDVVLSGFTVPKKAQVLVNVWAIGRDKNTWQNPDSFMPERFLNKAIDVKGTDYELIPFGAGRRICPGLPFAHRLLHVMLANLLLSFQWRIEIEIKPQVIDMSDKFGITLQKATPLKVIPIRM